MDMRVARLISMFSVVLLVESAFAQPAQLRLVPIDAGAALVVQVAEVEGNLSEAASQSVRAYGASLARYSQPALEVLVIASAPEADRDEAVALRRAVLVRDELSRASFLPRERFVLQVSVQSGLTKNPQETSIVVQPAVRQSAAPQPVIGPVYAWAPEARRFVIVCQDGYLPANYGSSAWPDDFAAFRGCPQSVAGAPSDRLRAEFDGAAGRWFLACPDGEPLRPRVGDLDDFSAIRRCNR